MRWLFFKCKYIPSSQTKLLSIGVVYLCACCLKTDGYLHNSYRAFLFCLDTGRSIAVRSLIWPLVPTVGEFSECISSILRKKASSGHTRRDASWLFIHPHAHLKTFALTSLLYCSLKMQAHVFSYIAENRTSYSICFASILKTDSVSRVWQTFSYPAQSN